MSKCDICCVVRKKGASFFRVPEDERRRVDWGEASGVSRWKSHFVCADHFLPSDLIKGKKVRLMPSAVPSVKIGLNSQFRFNTNAVPMVESAVFDSDIEISTLIKSFQPESILQNHNVEKDVLINEALFDHEENIEHETISEPFTGFQSHCNSKIIQTDGPIGDCITCGFVNISKTGPDKYFNLRCFYCDAEYPISLWSEFSEHIKSSHSQFEDDFKEIFDYVDIGSNYSYDEENLGLNTKEQKYSELIEILSDNSDIPGEPDHDSYELSYVNNIEHNYSQINIDPNKPIIEESINSTGYTDKLTLGETAPHIVIDFLNSLKGFPSLWHDRSANSKIYDGDLQKLMKLMILKWDLVLRIDSFRESLEGIKAWFYAVKKEKMENGDSHIEQKFGDYYEICSEFIYCEKGGQNRHCCNMCDMAFSNAILLRVHKVSKHKIGPIPFSCNKCRKQFTYIDSLLKHLPQHLMKTVDTKTSSSCPTISSTQNLECYICNKTFTDKIEYNMHLDLHPHGDRPFSCEECGRRFRKKYSLTSHKKDHEPPRYKCEFCPLKSKSRYNLRVHMEFIHKRNYEYVCEWCGRGFVGKNNYTEHRKFAHMGHGLCKICNREYKKRAILMKHLIRLHKPTFGTNEELSRRRHTLKCYRKRGSSLSLRKYEYILDPETKRCRLKCPKCERTFPKHRDVITHALKVHNYDVRKMKRGTQPGLPGRLKSDETDGHDSIVCIPTNLNNMQNSDDNVIEVDEIENSKHSFEKFVSEITTNNDNFSLQFPNHFLVIGDQSSDKLNSTYEFTHIGT